MSADDTTPMPMLSTATRSPALSLRSCSRYEYHRLRFSISQSKPAMSSPDSFDHSRMLPSFPSNPPRRTAMEMFAP